jgi:hypothetical protein
MKNKLKFKRRVEYSMYQWRKALCSVSMNPVEIPINLKEIPMNSKEIPKNPKVQTKSMVGDQPARLDPKKSGGLEVGANEIRSRGSPARLRRDT